LQLETIFGLGLKHCRGYQDTLPNI